MDYLAVLGRQTDISIAELEALFSDVKKAPGSLATFTAPENYDFSRLGGSIKVAVKIDTPIMQFLQNLPEGKITLGLSDYSKNANSHATFKESLKLKNILIRHQRSVRVVTSNASPVLSTATSLHNGLSGKNERKVELIKNGEDWYKVVFVQDIDAYARRDQARPARDAKVGMLPPKLAQILINLCGDLKPGSRILDPFCGTGVILQESILMGYTAYGTDLSDRMVEYSDRNLKHFKFNGYKVEVGDATNYKWQQPIDAVACEGYLGKPMSTPPVDIKLKTEKQECSAIILGFLKNLSAQIKSGTPVVIAAPAWLRENGSYSRLEILDEIKDMGYNVNNKSLGGLLYFREGQIVARDIIILRKN